MLHSRSLRRLLPCTLGALAALLLSLGAAQAQTRWVVDSKSSLAWWQMSPNLNHLWATTCPSDPDWRPGEGRSAGWTINPALKLPRTGYSNVEDTVHVPLYPRHQVRSICAEAVRGSVEVGDTTRWRAVHGTVYVRGEALITGERMRDLMMHQALETAQFPEVQLTVDSLVNVTKQGDTLHANAIGVMVLRGINTPVVAVVQAFPDGGGMRVLAKWRIPATDLATLTPMIKHLGLGVETRIWKTFFMGADVVFRPASAAGSAGTGQ